MFAGRGKRSAEHACRVVSRPDVAPTVADRGGTPGGSKSLTGDGVTGRLHRDGTWLLAESCTVQGSRHGRTRMMSCS